MTDQPQVSEESSVREEAASEKKGVSRAAIASVVMPVLAFLLPALPDLGVKIIIFAFFTPFTRIGCAAIGVMFGIVGCIYGGTGKNVALGFAGIALNVLTFVAAVLLATK